MDFSQFDVRKYPTVSVQEGYRQWAQTYEETVLDAMDLRLLSRIQSIAWEQMQQAADLACGTDASECGSPTGACRVWMGSISQPQWWRSPEPRASTPSCSLATSWERR